MVLKEENALETILERACIFREKKEIFLSVAKLLTILCTHENVRKVSRSKPLGQELPACISSKGLVILCNVELI